MDPANIWTSSITARRIHALGDVEKDISRLLYLASKSISLLTLPQTDSPDDSLPQNDERSEHLVEEVTQYFETLDSIQFALRTCLAQLRRDRVAPSSVEAAPAGFIPPTFGVGVPNDPSTSGSYEAESKGLQEVRVERDAWKGVSDALRRLQISRKKGEQIQQDDAMDQTSDQGVH